MKTAERRAALRDKLIDLARADIAAGGTDAIKARKLAQEAGCSLGAIYNVFEDLGQLVLAVNAETFKALGARVHGAVDPEASPLDRMLAMSEAYMTFADENPHLWRALFEAEASRAEDVPDWYLAALEELMQMIDGPVAEVFGATTPEDRRLQTKTLFSAIHGIVMLGVEDRLSSVGRDNMRQMIRFLLTRVTT